MADVIIDQIKMEIASDSSNAVESIDKLTASLSGLNTSLKRIGHNASGLKKVATALSTINNIRIRDFGNLIGQLERLSRIDLSNLSKLSGKNMDLKIQVSGLNETERMKVAVEQTASRVHSLTDDIAKDLARAFHMDGADTQRMKGIFSSIGKDTTKGGGESGQYLEEAYQHILKNGKMAETEFNAGIEAMKTDYQDFLEYLKNNKIKFTAEVDRTRVNDVLTQTERMNYFSQSKGTPLDTRWSEMIHDFPTVLSGLESIENEEDQVYAVISKIREAVGSIKPQKISLFDDASKAEIETQVYHTLMESFQKATDAIKGNISNNMAESARRIPLDLVIDQSKFEKQIADAVEQARNKDYGNIPVKIGVDTATLKNDLFEAFRVGGDIQNIQNLSTTLYNITNALHNISSINMKDTGIKDFVSAIKSMSEIDLSNFSTDQFNELCRSIQELANTFASANFSEGSIRMAEALAEISRNGGKVRDTLESTQETVNKSSTSMQAAEVIVNSFGDGFKNLINIVKSAGNGVANAISEIVSKVRELTSHTPKVNQLNISFKQLFTTMLGFRGISGVFNWIKDSLKLGGDLTEIDHIVDSVYGDMSDTVKLWAENMMETHGVASGVAKKYAGTLTALASSAGIASDQAAVMGVKLTEAAADLSAFYNISTEEAYKKIQSGMAGMVRPLQQLGISLHANTLAEYAQSKGIEKKYSAMTQAEKVMLRYDYLLTVLGDDEKRGLNITGDYERTMYSYANSLRRVQAYLSAIKTQIGAGLTAALRPALVAIGELLSRLLQAAKAFAIFMKTLFPFTNGASGMALGDSAGYMDDLADGADNTAEGLSDASDAAEKLKKDLSVLPFDELNQLNKDKTKDSSSDGSEGISGLGDLGTNGLYDWDGLFGSLDASKIPDAISAWAKKIRDAFFAQDWKGLGETIADLLNVGIDKIYKLFDRDKVAAKVNPYIDAFTTTFNSFIKKLNFKKLGQDIGKGLNILVDAANRILDPKTGINWKSIGTQLANGANGLIDELDFGAVGALLANKMNVLWQTASGFVTNFDWEGLGVNLATGVNKFVGHIDYESIKNTATRGLNGITRAINVFIRNFDAVGFGTKLASTFKGIVNGVKWGEIGQALAGVWNKAWEFLATTIKGLGNSDGRGTGIGTAIKTVLAEIVDNLDTKGMSSAISNFVNKVAFDIKEIFGNTTTWFGLGWKIGQGLYDAIDGINADDVAAAINAMATAITLLIEGACDYLNEHGDAIRRKFVDLISKIDWGTVLKAAAYLVAPSIAMGIAGLAFTATKNALKKKIAALLFGVGGSETVTGALPHLFSGIKSAIGKVFSKTGEVAKTLSSKLSSMFTSVGSSSEVTSAGSNIFNSVKEAIGVGAVEGGLIAAVVAATAEVQKFNDAVRGGNGEITEEGGIFDSVIEKLQTTYGYTTDETQALFDLKESLENKDIDDETFIVKAAETLSEMGVSSGLLNTIMAQLAGQVNITARQSQLMDGVMSGLSTTTNQAATEMQLFGDKDKAIGKVSDAIHKASIELASMDQDHLFTVKQNAITAFGEMVRGGSSFKDALSAIITNFELTDKDVLTVRKHINENFGTNVFDPLITASGTAVGAIGGIATKVIEAKGDIDSVGTSAEKAAGHFNAYNEEQSKTPTLFESVGKILGGLSTTLIASFGKKTQYSDKSKENVKAVGEGITNNAEEALRPMRTLVGDELLVISDSEKDFENTSKNIPRGIASGLKDATAVSEVESATESLAENYILDPLNRRLGINSPSTETYESGKYVIQGFQNGMGDNIQGLTDYINTSISGAIASQFETDFSNISSDAYDGGKDIISNFKSGIDDQSSMMSFTGAIYNMFDGVFGNNGTLASIANDFEYWGREMANSLSAGIQSIKLPKLQYYISSWDTHNWGNNKQVSTPRLSPHWYNWYAKGALFTEASVVGVGEAGKEAAIPLEDKRAMRMIANAITDNMGTANNSNLVEAVTQGCVRAMMANQGNRQQPTFNIICKTENDEVLFRAVERGRESVEYRNNPTPKYNY